MPFIAVLDDDRILWELYAPLLRDYDIEIVQYINKVDFFLNPPRLKPDIIVTDILSPGMDGYEFLTLLRQEPVYREVPVIVVTVAVDYDPYCEPRARSLGAFSVIAKLNGFPDLMNNIEFAIKNGKKYHYN